jgi:ATP-dependent DNA helicase RecQ
MDDPALHILKTTFGYAEFRGSQAAIIQQLIDGNDAVVLMPTGGGKSLCYQIPAMVRDGTGIVVSPLIALMQDQVSSLQQLGVNAAYLNSTLDAAEAADIENRLLAGRLDLLYVAPERMMTPGFLGLLQQSEIALFAIDEAHCVSQWGHDFRPEYIQLSILHERFPHIPRIALTATADEPTRNEIISRLDLSVAQQYVASFDRPNICYRITQNQGNARDALLRFILNEHENDAGIVYCLSRNKVEQTAEWLCTKGLTALPYHAGLPAKTRQKHQQRFLMEDKVIIVATIAFGMGIDKPDVRFVAHLNMPKSIEAYYQETGRAGRDGLPADAWMMYGLQDVIKLKQMMDSSQADEKHKRTEQHKLQSMLGFCELTTCRRQGVLRYFGEQLEQACGNCDTCLSPVETWDATVVAQKALSAVHRTGQRFGVTYLVDVLQGKDNERIKRFGHDTLSVHGIGDELDNHQWRSVFRQLIAHNLLTVDIEGHGNLLLTESCRAVLRGEQTLMLRKETKQAKTARKGRKSYNTSKASDSQLWEALRACRKQLAESNNVPPYVIFHDATLVEMVERQPKNRDQFSRISGVGESKLEKYADDFLAVIRSHIEQTSSTNTDTTADSLQLFKSGMDIAAIAAQRNIKPSTVYTHLAACIEQGEIELKDVIDLTDQELSAIHEAILATDDGQAKLKPVYDALDGMFDYEVLRCVRAAMTAV